ncbi:MAG TPA: hypothetical protein ENI54_00120 [bacterium]|nr:hypothetical protein [bacterium]
MAGFFCLKTIKVNNILKNITYFPGCAGSKNKSLGDVFEKLGLEVELIANWNCCGAPQSHNRPSFFDKVVMPLRNLGIAQQNGSDFIYSGCQVCVKQINEAVKTINLNSMLRSQAKYSLEPFNASLKNIESDSAGAIHLMDIITDPDVTANLLNNTVRNLSGHSILLYTGCYHDNRKTDAFKEILESFGANVNIYRECCGGEKLQNTTPVHSKRVENVSGIDAFFKKINRKADEINSDYIIAICSMCEKNIEDGVELSDLDVFAPVIGLTEYIGFLFGLHNFGDLISLVVNNDVNDEKRKLCV